jgi:hypothetical protein
MIARAVVRETTMVEIDRGCLLVALVLAVAGMLLGFYMGIAADNKLQTVHVARWCCPPS